MTDTRGFPATPGLAGATDRLLCSYDNAERRQREADQRARLNAEAPAMLKRLWYLVDAIDEFERNPTTATQALLRDRTKAAKAILARIDGEG